MGRNFDGAQFFGHGCIERDGFPEPALQHRIASNLLECFGKAWIVCVLAVRSIGAQNKFSFAIIHVIPPFCLIGRLRLYSRETPLLRAAAGATVLCHVIIATSPFRSAPRAYLRCPDTRIVPDKTASAARKMARPLRAKRAALSRCRTRSHSVRSTSPLRAHHPARLLGSGLHAVAGSEIRDTTW